MKNEDRGNAFSSGFLLGGLIGAGLVFLFGTEEGKKVKEQLVKKGKEVIEDLPETVKDLEKRGEEFAQRAEEVKQKLESKAKELSPKIKKQVESSLDHIEAAQKRGRQAAATIRKRFFVRKGKKLG
jgi:gas vesicle protein